MLRWLNIKIQNRLCFIYNAILFSIIGEAQYGTLYYKNADRRIRRYFVKHRHESNVHDK